MFSIPSCSQSNRRTGDGGLKQLQKSEIVTYGDGSGSHPRASKARTYVAERLGLTYGRRSPCQRDVPRIVLAVKRDSPIRNVRKPPCRGVGDVRLRPHFEPFRCFTGRGTAVKRPVRRLSGPAHLAHCMACGVRQDGLCAKLHVDNYDARPAAPRVCRHPASARCPFVISGTYLCWSGPVFGGRPASALSHSASRSPPARPGRPVVRGAGGLVQDADCEGATHPTSLERAGEQHGRRLAAGPPFDLGGVLYGAGEGAHHGRIYVWRCWVFCAILRSSSEGQNNLV